MLAASALRGLPFHTIFAVGKKNWGISCCQMSTEPCISHDSAACRLVIRLVVDLAKRNRTVRSGVDGGRRPWAPVCQLSRNHAAHA